MRTKLNSYSILGCAVMLTVSAAACSAGNQQNNSKDLSKPTATLDQPSVALVEEKKVKPLKPTMAKMDRKQQIAAAQADLAQKLGVKVDEVSVSGALNVTWRSGALGCPKPGMQYTNAMVPGLSIMLTAQGQVYRYHAKTFLAPFHCPSERAEKPYHRASDI